MAAFQAQKIIRVFTDVLQQQKDSQKLLETRILLSGITLSRANPGFLNQPPTTTDNTSILLPSFVN
ncbi:MAG: hypothetical protein H7Y13_13820 [Sphingobacteriaceae bacterium]|nr:hypothetical protein [Sphingobacteriaceae bacterium]